MRIITKSQFEELKHYIKDLLASTTATTAKKSNKVKKSKRKPLEFSQKWLIVLTFVGVFYTSLSFYLSFLDKNPVESLSIELVRIIWGTDGICFLGYNFQNCIRAWSLNNANAKIATVKTSTEDMGDIGAPNNDYFEGS